MTTAPTPLSQRRSMRPLALILLGALLGAAIATGIALAVRAESNASGTLRGSGAAATQTRTLPPFSAVDLAGSNNVSIHVGGEQAVIVRGDDNLLKYVTTGVRDGELVIGESRSLESRSRMSVEITVPSLGSLVLAGSGILDVEGAHGGLLSVRAPGSGVLSASGSVRQLDVSLAGSGSLQLRQLVARDVSASISGSGRIDVDATRSLNATVSGSGAIFYSGNPIAVSRNVSGSGVILGR
jgi:hypothetical protein